MLPKTNLADFLKTNNKIKDGYDIRNDYNFKQWFGGLDDWFGGLDKDTGDVKWIKQIRLSDGCSDPKKLAVLGQLMTGIVEEAKHQKIVRDVASWIIHTTGGHWEDIKERHPIKNKNGQLSNDPILHTHRRWLRGVKNHDAMGELTALARWCQIPNIRYVYDPHNVEYFITPRRAIIDKIRGVEALDCDDKSMLFCALAASIGYPTAIMICNPRGGPYSHAMGSFKLLKSQESYYYNYKIMYPANRWIPVELTIIEEVSWIPPMADKFHFFPVK